ncbi:Spindle pole body associated protein SnaD [Teratosphaeria destructans]|uniref:Spindle pole body associated protein SnaD n=1 Tax=Teratosphaeria destructans TaxID=418781 RepID=A0A9W7SYB3_9PEZI|nr:Spindle pole body associated protein SnaD [Teratosphaeria destructans]
MAMQSSPPVRAWERPDSAGSQYSLDLGALDIDSDDEQPLPKQKIERIFSEDIDGPSDFTLNMEKWMRGGGVKKTGTARSGKAALQSGGETQEADKRIESLEQFLQPPSPPQHEDEDHSMSHHTPDQSPPKESVWDDQSHEEHADSEWDPYTEASHTGAPKPSPHKQLLQPTVEEYCSELTPARKPSTVHASESPMHGTSLAEAHISPSTTRTASPGRPSSPTLSPVRSPATHRSAPSAQFPDEALRQQLLQLQARCQQLEHLNSALKQALDEETRIRKQEKMLHDMQMAEAVRREQHLTEMKQEVFKHAEEFRAEYGEQKERMRKLEAEAAVAKKEVERQGQKHAEEMGLIRDDLNSRQATFEQQLQTVKHERKAALRAREDAEEAVRLHREELEQTRDAHESEIDRLRGELRKAEDSRTTIAELNAELKDVRDELASIKQAKIRAEDATKTLRTELATTRQERDGEITRITADHRRAVEMAEKLQRQSRDLQQQVRDQKAAHETEIDRLKDEQRQANAATSTEIKVLRTQIEDQGSNSALNTAVIDRDAAQDQLSDLHKEHLLLQSSHQSLQFAHDTLQSELLTLKDQIEDMQTINAAFEAKVSDSVKKREQYWKTRVTELERERKVMGKALMAQWGREEVGKGVPGPEQGFEYLYAKRGVSPSKS